MLPYILNHTEVGKSRVIDDLSEKENFNKLLTVFLEEINILETEMFKLAGSKSISGSSGIWLDYIGKIVSEDRNNRSDAEYKAALLLRVSINTANGTIKSLISVVRSYTEALIVRYTPYYPAHYVVTTTGSNNLIGALHELVEDVSPAGVSSTVISNKTGNKFVPAWITTKPNEVVEHVFLLDNFDDLLLDDGEPLLITATPDLSYFEGTKEHSKFDWGVTQNAQSVGYLAQVILPQTTQ